MSTEGGNGEDVREFRLEGMTLVVAAAVLVLALGGAFMLGRWVERGRTQPAGLTAETGTEDPLARVDPQKPADVDESSGFFDRVEESGAEAEPGREARRDRPEDRQEAAQTAKPEPAAEAGSGSYFVQVWAGRDRDAAELLVEKLQKEGYAVKIVSDRVEGDTLFKVRVGGYESESEARRMSGELEAKGYRGAWVTSAG
jgi:cell division septation protein DedD